MSKSGTNFVHALAAVLAGNVAYFLLEPHLPVQARHVSFRTDLGTLVDFFLCLLLFGTIKSVAARRERSRETKN
jgi:hypothetical protein